jgi:hypothetical protein
VDGTTATTALLLAEVRLAVAWYALQAEAAAVACATGQAYQSFDPSASFDYDSVSN